MRAFSFVYWASVIAAVDLLYALAAFLWPFVFNRGAIQHGRREASGYRLGRAIYWRLPTPAVAVVLFLAMLPLLLALFLKSWVVTSALVVSTGIAISLWFIGPPGLRLVYSEQTLENGQRVFVSQPSRNHFRAFIILVVFGLVPGLAAGAVLSQALTQWIGG